MTSSRATTDVIVVGMGPVGAALAGLLGMQGIRVTVIEREQDVFPLPRAAHVDHTGLRTWQALGVLDRILPSMQINRGLDFVSDGGELLARIPGDQASPSGLPSSAYFFQPSVDRLIRDVVSALPNVSIMLETQLITVEQTGDAVTAIAKGPAGERVDLSAEWLVGCDGANSTAREYLGVQQRDSGFTEPWLVVDLKVSSPVAESDRAICWCDPLRPTYSIPMPLGRHRFEFRIMDGDDLEDMLRAERIQELVDPWFPIGTAEVERSAIYTFHGLVAEEWRSGRVLLAGDAAHQMPPFLGQGMCSGLRDASNLAWKLALVVNGAPEGLLETYGSERKPHASAFVDAAVSFGRIICVVEPAEAAERDKALLNDPRPPASRLTFALPELQPGTLVLDGGGELFIQPTSSATRLDDYVGSRFSIFTRNRHRAATPAASWWESLGALVCCVDDLVPEYREPVSAWLTAHECESVIVRPDRYVMWAGADLDGVTAEVSPLLSTFAFRPAAY